MVNNNKSDLSCLKILQIHAFVGPEKSSIDINYLFSIRVNTLTNKSIIIVREMQFILIYFGEMQFDDNLEALIS